LQQAPDYLVLHVGTNDLKQSSPRQISTSLANLGQEIQTSVPTTKLIISEVIMRNDDPQISAKVKEVNSKLLQVCKNNKWEHVSHKNIVEKHLNPYGVHLNKQGTIALAKNFTDFLKSSY
jgi:lysophospholipase L1-like esterase